MGSALPSAAKSYARKIWSKEESLPVFVILSVLCIHFAFPFRSKLHLVDLAGSERVSKTGVAGVQLNEAKCINLSLLHLQVGGEYSERGRWS